MAELTDAMAEPEVVKEIGGGHLGALMDIENCAVSVTDYINKRV